MTKPSCQPEPMSALPLPSGSLLAPANRSSRAIPVHSSPSRAKDGLAAPLLPLRCDPERAKCAIPALRRHSRPRHRCRSVRIRAITLLPIRSTTHQSTPSRGGPYLSCPAIQLFALRSGYLPLLPVRSNRFQPGPIPSGHTPLVRCVTRPASPFQPLHSNPVRPIRAVRCQSRPLIDVPAIAL